MLKLGAEILTVRLWLYSLPQQLDRRLEQPSKLDKAARVLFCFLLIRYSQTFKSSDGVSIRRGYLALKLRTISSRPT